MSQFSSASQMLSMPLVHHRSRAQKTLRREMTMEGVGLFTGAHIRMKWIPAPFDTGIVFQRVDLPNIPLISAHVDNVLDTPRCTILGNKDLYVQTVEHVLSALCVYEIDNLIIQIDGSELPICDGSALPFVNMIESAGVIEQNENKPIYGLVSPVYWEDGNVCLIALPADQLRISYTMSYPHSSLLKAQFYSGEILPDEYKKEIAPSRTFALYEEIIPLIEKGFLKGGSLENALIIKDDQVLNPGGVRVEDEMVKHKVLDLIGDLSLVGCSIAMHVVALRSGHCSNASLARVLAGYFKELSEIG